MSNVTFHFMVYLRTDTRSELAKAKAYCNYLHSTLLCARLRKMPYNMSSSLTMHAALGAAFLFFQLSLVNVSSASSFLVSGTAACRIHSQLKPESWHINKPTNKLYVNPSILYTVVLYQLLRICIR